LTKWEGTKWAKERFERDQGIRIRDTAADGLLNYVDPNDPYSAQALRAGSEETDDPVAAREEHGEGHEDEDEETDEELESVGVDLNERLRERVAMRHMSGDNSMPLDEEWENWLKHAIESGELPHVADQIARFPGPHNALEDIFPPRMMAAARAGQFDEIPDFLHVMIRQALESAERRVQTSTGASGSSRPAIRYTNVLDTLARVALVGAADQQGSRLELFRPPEPRGHRPAQSANRSQQTAQPGA
jgi:hypothetical protein